MRKRIVAILAYTGAALMLAVAVCVPFVLMGTFSSAVAHAGLHIDAAYSGGGVARTLERPDYTITINRPVYPRTLQRVDPFVQIAFAPATSLPVRVSEDLDLEGNGHPSVRIAFTVPADPHAHPPGTVTSLSDRYQSFSMPGPYSFSRLVVRSGNAIIVRVPLNKSK